MDSIRKNRLKELQNYQQAKNVANVAKISAIYAENVFTLDTAAKYLSKEAFEELRSSTTERYHKISRAVADQIANGLRNWAMSKNVTHYTHWFQPLSGATAEKHDTFFSLDHSTGRAIERLDGDTLIQQEPDASSFPSGGLRATFEARGYSAWDPSSPAFIIENEGKTLCIPTIFISYNGESLDYKAPLLKSCDALNKSAVAVCNFFDKNVHQVIATLGWEQEYFLIDRGLANARPDLVMAHRTLIGNSSAKGQQLEDHYFGSIHERVYHFMRDFETESYKLGIPLKTRHNEVAPAQFECAPIFEEVSIAVDHNLLLMDLMSRIALKHNFMVLFHEKPFKGINGSGKHNNWSMSTNTGVNLLSPGKTPKSNLMFLTFFVNTIKAVHDHARLLQASIASAGNEHRLGANEAPPSIISVFIGRFLSKVLQEIEDRVDEKFDEQDESIFKMDIHKNIPEILLDNTDRNRTSPFAFTGNKFEFRAVGSSANCAGAMTTMNSIMSKTLNAFHAQVSELIAKGDKKEIAILHVLREYIKKSKSVLFEGDGYSKDWEKEAKKRSLPNVKSAPEAWKVLEEKEAEEVFIKNNIFSKGELKARYEIELDKYVKKIDIESTVLIEMLQTNVIPVSIGFQENISRAMLQLNKLGVKAETLRPQGVLLDTVSQHINKILQDIGKLQTLKESIEKHGELEKIAEEYASKLCPMLLELRKSADALELLVDDELWRLPKYRELLLLR